MGKQFPNQWYFKQSFSCRHLKEITISIGEFAATDYSIIFSELGFCRNNHLFLVSLQTCTAGPGPEEEIKREWF